MTCHSVSPRSESNIFGHFALRLKERFGITDGAFELWRWLAEALAEGDWENLQPVARVSRCGKRIFAFALTDGRMLYVLYDGATGLPMTVFHEGMVIPREGKPSIRLGGVVL